MYHLKSGLRSKTHSLNLANTESDDVRQVPYKKQKVSSPPHSAKPGRLAETNDVNLQSSKKVYFRFDFISFVLIK
jgi:hypothetical protein